MEYFQDVEDIPEKKNQKNPLHEVCMKSLEADPFRIVSLVLNFQECLSTFINKCSFPGDLFRSSFRDFSSMFCRITSSVSLKNVLYTYRFTARLSG